MSPIRVFQTVIALAALAVVGPVLAAYPDKPVRIVVPYAPGGAVDVVARKVAQKLSEQTGQSFFVELRRPVGRDASLFRTGVFIHLASDSQPDSSSELTIEGQLAQRGCKSG